MNNFGYKQPRANNKKTKLSLSEDGGSLERFFFTRFQEILGEQEMHVDYTLPAQLTITISNSLDSSLMIAEA